MLVLCCRKQVPSNNIKWGDSDFSCVIIAVACVSLFNRLYLLLKLSGKT